MTNISIMVNGEPRETEAGRSVEALLEELGLQPRLVVVERNREILDRAAYADTRLAPGDVLELVHFVGGG
jgi:sulfur carrier protein